MGTVFWKKLGARAGACCVVSLLAGCGTRKPVLYPNEHYQRVGDAAAERDIDDCMRRAKVYVKTGSVTGPAASQAAKETAVGGASGAAIGVVGGAISGSPGEGAAIGAATGATAGLLHSMFTASEAKDPVLVNFVDRCLREKGYDPIGWK
jgi:hypothetical protein